MKGTSKSNFYPLVKGGQGRSAAEVWAAAENVLFVIYTLFALGLLFGILSLLEWLITAKGTI